MVWEYLGAFWDKIVSVGEYTVIWFQNIGNAVAGAIGNFFDSTVHLITDIGVLFSWLFSQLKEIFIAILTPFTYVYALLKALIAGAFSTPVVPVSYTWDNGVLSTFNAIPNWSIFGTVLGAMVLLFLGLSVIRSVNRSL